VSSKPLVTVRCFTCGRRLGSIVPSGGHPWWKSRGRDCALEDLPAIIREVCPNGRNADGTPRHGYVMVSREKLLAEWTEARRSGARDLVERPSLKDFMGNVFDDAP